MTSKKINHKKPKTLISTIKGKNSSVLDNEQNLKNREITGELPKDARETYEEPLANTGFFKTNVSK